MSENAKKLLMRLKKEKKTAKQVELVSALKDYNNEGLVNHVLAVHLKRKDNPSVRLEILGTLNPDHHEIVDPLIEILKNPLEEQAIIEKCIALLSETEHKKALKAILSFYKKNKEETLYDNLLHALANFNDKKVEKPLIKALNKEETTLAVLTGLARNETLTLSSLNLLKKIAGLELSKNFEKLQFDRIIEYIYQEYGIKDQQELQQAIADKTLEPKIKDYIKKQSDIEKTLKKVQH